MSRLPIARFIRPGDDAAPNFDITISGRDAVVGTQLFEAIRPLIAGISYEEDEEMASMLEISVINQPETGPGKPVNWNAVLDSKAFSEGNSVDLYMGYGLLKLFVGRVDLVKWTPKFAEDGVTTFPIKGFDGRHKMTKGNQFRVRQTGKNRKRRTFYKGLPDETIVKKIAEKYGYGVRTDATERKRRKVKVKLAGIGLGGGGAAVTVDEVRAVFPTRVHPADMPDWQFLRKLAAINRFDLWVDFDQSKNKYMVNFRKREDIGQAAYSFNYNGDDGSLISAEPNFEIQDQPTDVEVLYYDTRRRKVEKTTISDLNPAENVNFKTATRGKFQAKKEITKGARVRFSAFGQTIEALADRPFRSKKEAESFVKNWLSERERDFLIAQFKVVGIEDLHPRQVHEFTGMSKRLDGFYRLTQVKHTMQPGGAYTCDLVGHKVLSQEITRRKKTTKVVTKKATVAGG